MTLAELTIPAPNPGPADWNDDGYLIVENLIIKSLSNRIFFSPLLGDHVVVYLSTFPFFINIE